MCETNKTELLRSNLSALRKKNHLTQEQLADRLGLTFQAVSKWENGLSCPDISLLPELAGIFGVTVDDLFRENAAEKAPEPPKTAPETPSGTPENTPEAPLGGPDLSDVLQMTQDLLNGTSEPQKPAPEVPDNPEPADAFRLVEGLMNDADSADSPEPEDSDDEDGTFFFHGELKSAPTADGLPWPDDKTYRAVLFLGHTLVTVPVEKKGEITWKTDVQGRILSAFSMSCSDVKGSVHANGDVNCRGVLAGVTAGGDVDCADVAGSVSAGGDVDCGQVMGDARASGDLDCGGVAGNVSAGGDVDCGNVEGSVTAGGDVDCGNVGGRIAAGGDVSVS